MSDVLLVLVVLGFLALCALYVRGCEAVIRGSQVTGPSDPADDEAVR